MEDDKKSSACSINRKFLPVKVAYFTLFAGMACLWNFIALHMKSLGLSPSEIGIILGTPPFIGGISTVLGGAIADRYRIHSQLCGGLTIITTFIQLLLLFIPNVIHEDGRLVQNCTTDHTTLTSFSQVLNTTSFGSNLTSFPIEVQTEIPLGAPNCKLQCCDTSSSFVLNCDNNDESRNISLLTNRNNNLDIQWNCFLNTEDVDNFKPNTSCSGFLLQTNNNVDDLLCQDNSSMQDFNLTSECNGINFIGLSCSQVDNDFVMADKVHKKYGLTFWVYFAIYGVASFLMNPIWPLLNAIVYSMLGEERNTWGKHRLWGTLGDGLVVFPMSLAMHFAGSDDEPSFVPNFVAYLIITTIGGICICCLQGKVKVGAKPSVWKDLKEILKIWETYMLLVLGFVFGAYLAAISTLLPLYITDFADGNEMLVALSIVMNIAGETPMMFLANRIIDSLGYVRCLYLSCLAFFFRFALYAIIPSPWYILPINLLHGINFGIMYTTLTAYMSKLTPPALHGTTQGLVSTVTWNFGYGCGSTVFAEMMDRIGAKDTFAFLSICSLATLVIYFVYINVIVRLCNKDKSSDTKEFRLITTSGNSTEETAQPLLSSDNSDDSDSGFQSPQKYD